MAFATRLSKVRYQSEHFNERTWMCYHQAPPWVGVVAHVGEAGQAKPHLEHNPLSLLGTCHAMPLRKLNDPAAGAQYCSQRCAIRLPHWRAACCRREGYDHISDRWLLLLERFSHRLLGGQRFWP